MAVAERTVPQTGATPKTITVDREQLLELGGFLHATNDLLQILVGNVSPTPLSDFFFLWLDVFDDWFVVEWDDNKGPNNDPHYKKMQAAAAELIAEMLDAIVADPEERLVPRKMTRRELAEAANEHRDVEREKVTV